LFSVIGPNPRCPKRAALAKELVDAAEVVHKAKKAYEEVRKSKFATQGELLRLIDTLNNARNRARAAQRALDQHVAVHNCRA
jgi:hypothetical protein